VVHIKLRARLVDLRASRMVGVQQFDVTKRAVSDDSYGGVVAANRAVSLLLDELTQFCVRQLR